MKCPMTTNSMMLFLHEHKLAGKPDLFFNVFFEWFRNPFAEMIQNRKFRERKNWHCLSCKLVPETSSDVLSVLPPYFVSTSRQMLQKHIKSSQTKSPSSVHKIHLATNNTKWRGSTVRWCRIKVGQSENLQYQMLLLCQGEQLDWSASNCKLQQSNQVCIQSGILSGLHRTNQNKISPKKLICCILSVPCTSRVSILMYSSQ